MGAPGAEERRLLHRIAIGFLMVGCLTTTTTAQEAVTRAVVVSASRLPDPTVNDPFAIRAIPHEELARAPQLRLDDLLRTQVPGFSTFRRNSSRVAHPTTQSVTLRNFGPSSASRTLVLLDGIPLNDPFAGYVQWNQLPPAMLESVVVQSGGGAGLFGNAALAGAIFVTSRAHDAHIATAEAFIGTAETWGLNAHAAFAEKALAGSFFAEHFVTGGYPIVRAEQRGGIDRDATSESSLLQFAATGALSRTTSLEIRTRAFEEERGNGTPYTGNATRAQDVSVAITNRFPEQSAELRVAGYYQHRKFRSTFSAVSEARDVETPALDQFDVPADAAGGSAVWAFASGRHEITLGADTRWVSGQTNELFRFVNGDFTRLRIAGGEQFFLGLFAEDSWRISDTASLLGGIRYDYWRLFDAGRDEFDRTSEEATLRSPFPNRDGESVNGRLGANIGLTNDLLLRAAGYTGFRVPTLNELYRPFRVGNVVTEENPALNPEQLYGVEAALAWRPRQTLRFAGTVFYNRLDDAIGNVTINSTLRRRQNIERVSAPGFELSSDWQIASPLFLRASYLWTEPTISRSSAPELRGRLLAQTPEHVGTVILEFRPASKWLVTAQGRYNGRQFEDDQNTLELAPFFTLDAAIFYEPTDSISAGLKLENLFDTEIETGRSPDGLVSIGAPRLVTLQVGWRL